MTWAELNKTLRSATEDACTAMLEKERAGLARQMWIERIYQRYNKLRRKREIAQLLAPGKKWKKTRRAA